MIGNAVLALTQSSQSTFKIPHALAALDAKVIDETTLVKYDGHPVDFPAWRDDDLPPLVAVEQAKRGLIDARVLR